MHPGTSPGFTPLSVNVLVGILENSIETTLALKEDLVVLHVCSTTDFLHDCNII